MYIDRKKAASKVKEFSKKYLFKKTQEPEEYRFMGERVIPKGHSVFQFSPITGKLKCAEILIDSEGKKRINQDPTCLYISALNREGARTKLEAKGFKQILPTEKGDTFSQPKGVYIRFYIKSKAIKKKTFLQQVSFILKNIRRKNVQKKQQTKG